MVPFLASKTLEYFITRGFEEKLKGKVEVICYASPFFLFNQRFNEIKGNVTNFKIRGVPEGRLSFTLKGGRLHLIPLLKGEDFFSFFSFDLLELKGNISEESLNQWLKESNHGFQVDIREGKITLLFPMGDRDSAVPGRLEAKEGKVYFLPDIPWFFQLFLGSEKVLLWGRPEIYIKAVDLREESVIWRGEVKEDAIEEKF